MSLPPKGSLKSHHFHANAGLAPSKLTAGALPENVTVAAANLGTDAVETAKIKNLAVTAAKLAADAVETAKIKDLNVTAGKLAADAVETAKVKDANITWAKLEAELGVKSADVTISNAEVLNLHVTPKTIVAAPGANKAIVPLGIVVRYVYASAAYANIAAGDDIAFKYTDGSGTAMATLETTGMLDQTADKVAYVMPTTGSPLLTANAPLVASIGGAIDTGGGSLNVRCYYRVVPTNI